MNRMPILIGATLAGAMALGCGTSSTDGGGGPVTFPTAALTTLQSAEGALRIEVRSAPDEPPARGIDSIEYTITAGGTADAADGGAPVDGLAITVVPWMPDMGHGASVTPTVTATGGGRYVVSDVELFMPGKWELRTTIAGPAEDSVTPSFQIP
jgi:YtkA-like